MKQVTDCSKKNVFKINLENFQSISKASLEFIRGINLIVGQSNSGKSAILRAIKGAILNPNGSKKYIKDKTNEFKVNINYEGNDIEWSRNAKSPKYIVNGEEYQKVGNSDLMDILDSGRTGFVLDENGNLMNIESELELPFPFDKNNSELFKLFEKNIFCVSDSTTITKLIKADEEEVNRHIDNATHELERYSQKVKAIEELEEFVDLNKLIDGRNKLSKLNNDSQKIRVDLSELRDKIELGKVLSTKIPVLEINTNLQNDYSILLNDTKKLEEIKSVGLILKAIEPLETKIVNTQAYLELRKAIIQLGQAQELISILRALEAPTLRGITDEYVSLRHDINTLYQLKEQAQNVQNRMEELKKKIQQLEVEKSKFKVCPLCGKDL